MLNLCLSVKICGLKLIFQQLAVRDSEGAEFFVGHVAEVGIHHSGKSVVGHQEKCFAGAFGFFREFVQKVVDSLGCLHVGLAARPPSVRHGEGFEGGLKFRRLPAFVLKGAEIALN